MIGSVPVCVLPTYRVLMEKYTIHKNTVPKVPIVLNSDGARPLRAHLHRFIPTYCSLPLAVRVLLDAVTRRQLHLLFPPCCCSSSPCCSPLLIPSSSCSSLLLLASCSWFLVPGSDFASASLLHLRPAQSAHGTGMLGCLVAWSTQIE